jgi:hypothetical protein
MLLPRLQCRHLHAKFKKAVAEQRRIGSKKTAIRRITALAHEIISRFSQNQRLGTL